MPAPSSGQASWAAMKTPTAMPTTPHRTAASANARTGPSSYVIPVAPGTLSFAIATPSVRCKRFFAGGPSGGLILVKQDAFGLVFKAVELAGIHSPAEHGHDEQHQDDREGDEEVEDVHGFQRFRRWALRTTKRELVA